jgi:hypothetical protein
MGYEIAGGLGVRMACPDRDVFVMVGDGSYLMMATELVTAVQEGIKLIVVLVQNHGFASIGALSESLGSQRFGTRYRYRSTATGRLDGDVLAGGEGRNSHHRRARRDRSADRRTELEVVVGRSGEPGLDPGLDAARLRLLFRPQGDPTVVSTTDRGIDRPGRHHRNRRNLK